MFQYICIISWKKNQYACNTSIFNLRCAPCKLAGLALSWQKPSGSLVGGVGAWPDRRLSAEKCWTILPQDTPWIQSFRVDGGKPWNHDAARSISYDLNGFRGMERIETKQDPLKQNGIHLIWVKSMILQDPHYIFVSQGATSNSFQAIWPGPGMPRMARCRIDIYSSVPNIDLSRHGGWELPMIGMKVLEIYNATSMIKFTRCTSIVYSLLMFQCRLDTNRLPWCLWNRPPFFHCKSNSKG